MSEITIYCVQTYWKDRRRLNMGDLRQFKDEGMARSSADRASKRQDGVVLYAITGDPDVDFWDEPVVLAAHGETPLSACQ